MSSTKLFVRILRDTIKPNPNAGRTSFSIPQPWRCAFRYNGVKLPDYLPVEQIARAVEYFNPGDCYFDVELRNITPKQHEQLYNDPNLRDGINMSRDLIEVTHRPEPAYLYKYEDPELICQHCGKLVKLSEIEEDSFDTDEDSYPIYHACPHCGRNNDLDVKYETIQDALATTNP